MSPLQGSFEPSDKDIIEARNQEIKRLIRALNAMQSNRNDRDLAVKELLNGLVDFYIAVKTSEVLPRRIPETLKKVAALIKKHK